MPTLRQRINDNPGLVGGIAVALLVIALLILVWVLWPKSTDADAVNTWYYDVNAKELYAASARTPPPTAAPSGGEGVAAVVYACHDCNDAGDRWISYLWKLPEEAVDEAQRLAASDASDQEVLSFFNRYNDIRLVRRAQGGAWVSADSEAGARVAAYPGDRCGGQPPLSCLPE